MRLLFMLGLYKKADSERVEDIPQVLPAVNHMRLVFPNLTQCTFHWYSTGKFHSWYLGQRACAHIHLTCCDLHTQMKPCGCGWCAEYIISYSKNTWTWISRHSMILLWQANIFTFRYLVKIFLLLHQCIYRLNLFWLFLNMGLCYMYTALQIT